jgi:hypothetical protein
MKKGDDMEYTTVSFGRCKGHCFVADDNSRIVHVGAHTAIVGKVVNSEISENMKNIVLPEYPCVMEFIDDVEIRTSIMNAMAVLNEKILHDLFYKECSLYEGEWDKSRSDTFVYAAIRDELVAERR